MSKLSSGSVSGPGVAFCIALTVAGAVGTAFSQNPEPSIAGAVIGLYGLLAIKVVQQWEKVAVLRFGRYVRLQGPGVFWIVPVVDTLTEYVDQRIRVTSVSAESTLTRDTVPTNVDAIVFWLVWNAEKCLLEVANFENSILMSAQTALREAIGRHELSQMIAEREMMGH